MSDTDRREIAQLKQGLEELKGKVPDRQWYERKDYVNKRIKELEGIENEKV